MTGTILSIDSMPAFPRLDAAQDADAMTDRALAATRRSVTPNRGRPLILAPSRADVTAAMKGLTVATARASRRSGRPALVPAAMLATPAPAACLHC